MLDKLLGTPPTPPPPNTATDLSQKAGELPKTVRARLEQHRNKASCKQCHGVIDPIGLALENFDAIGEWRTMDRQANAPIDAKTVLPNGVPIDGTVELKDAAGRTASNVRRGVHRKAHDVRSQPRAANTSTCPRFERWFAGPRRTTTSSLPLFWESSIRMPSASRVRPSRKEDPGKVGSQ